MITRSLIPFDASQMLDYGIGFVRSHIDDHFEYLRRQDIDRQYD